MQTATWLTSRQLAEAAGRWDTRMISDDDGGILLPCAFGLQGDTLRAGSKGIYRVTAVEPLELHWHLDKKKTAMLLSMKLHVKVLAIA